MADFRRFPHPQASDFEEIFLIAVGFSITNGGQSRKDKQNQQIAFTHCFIPTALGFGSRGFPNGLT
jgi:hypothetical protein